MSGKKRKSKWNRLCSWWARLTYVCAAFVAATSFDHGFGAYAGEADTRPRFVSLRSAVVNMREGPSTRHRVKWVYHRQGLPLQVLAEYDVWRRVRDMDGEVGWIHAALLANERTAIVTGSGRAAVRITDNMDAELIAEAEPGVTAMIESCGPVFCRLDFSGVEGWVYRSRLWGVYADEHL